MPRVANLGQVFGVGTADSSSMGTQKCWEGRRSCFHLGLRLRAFPAIPVAWPCWDRARGYTTEKETGSSQFVMFMIISILFTFTFIFMYTCMYYHADVTHFCGEKQTNFLRAPRSRLSGGEARTESSLGETGYAVLCPGHDK